MKRDLGFTLLELILVLAILAIVTSLAVPSLMGFTERYRSEVQRQRLFDLIALGRSEAYSEGRTFTLCSLDSENLCGGNWSNGIQLFADSNGNKEREADEPVVREMSALPNGASLQWNSATDYLQYRPNGQTRWQLGNFAYCPPDRNAEHGWIIVLNATGRPYFGRDSDHDGIMENGSGIELDCAND